MIVYTALSQVAGENSAVTALGVLFALSLLLLLVLTAVVVVQAVMLKRARSGSEYMWHSAIHTSEWERMEYMHWQKSAWNI